PLPILPAGDRLLRSAARAEADRRPVLRGRHHPHARVRVRDRAVRRLRQRPARDRRVGQAAHARGAQGHPGRHLHQELGGRVRSRPAELQEVQAGRPRAPDRAGRQEAAREDGVAGQLQGPERGRVMNGAHWLVQALEAEGVDTLFGYPGGTIMPFYDALHGASLKHVLVRHEQGAAFAANGYARASGRVGVCVATSGPGASNLVTGIADAMLDSVPTVVITGQVPTALMGTDAVQQLDAFGRTMPMVKHSFIARRVEDLPMMVGEAFRLARSGRPGPVLIDLPKDVQIGDAAHLPAHVTSGIDAPEAPKDASLHAALALIAQAQRPLLYGGGGIALGEAVTAFRTFVDATQIPTVLTLKGLGALPTQHPLNLGMLGMHGSRAANLAVQEADLLIVVGARFDDRATGKLAEFAPNARVVHMDIDACEIGK